MTSAHVLSVVIPAYNEERYIATTLERVLAVDLSIVGFSREVIVVDDHSSDRTPEIAGMHSEVSVHRLPRHAGKGGAVRAAVALARGDYLVIQDADLEYDPQAFVPMLRALVGDGRRRGLRQPLPERGQTSAAVAARVPGRAEPVGGGQAADRALAVGRRPPPSSSCRCRSSARSVCRRPASNWKQKSPPSCSPGAAASSRCPSPTTLARDGRARKWPSGICCGASRRSSAFAEVDRPPTTGYCRMLNNLR